MFDLVRRVNSDKGELEVNTLIIQHKQSEMSQLYTAPEIEYAFADGKAIEFELPIVDGKIKTFKGAFQMQLPKFVGDINGLQIIYEKVNGESIHEVTPLLLIGAHHSGKWSTFTMLGNRFVFGDASELENKKLRELPIINVNLFYNYAELFDLGFEVNLRGVGAGYDELIMMPQLHALLKEDFKIQFGFGTSYDGYEFSPVSAIRIIQEFNHGI